MWNVRDNNELAVAPELMKWMEACRRIAENHLLIHSNFVLATNDVTTRTRSSLVEENSTARPQPRTFGSEGQPNRMSVSGLASSSKRKLKSQHSEANMVHL